MMELLTDHKDVLIASCGLLSVIFTAYVAVGKQRIARLELEHKDRELDIAKKELSFQSHALSFGAFLEDWASTSEAMQLLMNETAIDRILILRAWNGTMTPKWATAVFQMREIGQQPVQYIHAELDDDYIERLRKIVSGNIISFSVIDQPDSFIKDIYSAEGVKSSCWAYINSQQVADSEAVSISYASFSSSTAEVLDAATITKCRILAGRLKGLAANFDEDMTRH
jgi:hypothetical protein